MSPEHDVHTQRLAPDLPVARHIPELDGLRAVSISLVLLSHFGLRQMVPGGFGVTVFFFISGLLITKQLLAENLRTGRIDLPAFAMRRMLRLYPALLVMVLGGGLLFELLGGRVLLSQIAVSLLFGTNFLLLAGGLPSGLASDYHPYAILWSLAIEEHFYLVFPLFLLLTARLRVFGPALVAAIVLLTLWRLHVALSCDAGHSLCLGADAADRVAYGSDTRIDGILFGAALAVVMDRPVMHRPGVKPMGLHLLGRNRAVPAGAILLLLAGFVIRDPWFRLTWMYTVQGIGLLLGIGWLLAAGSAANLRRALSWRPVTLVGRWSYSLYLWHWVVLVCAGAILPGGLARLTGENQPGENQPGWHFSGYLPLLLAASFALAGASYNLVERPALRLRRRFGSSAEKTWPRPNLLPLKG